MTLNDVLGRPTFDVELGGNVYPIRLKDYDYFSSKSSYFMINRKHFERGLKGQDISEIYLLELLLRLENAEDILNDLTDLFKIIYRTDKVEFTLLEDAEFGFMIDDRYFLDKKGYEKLRPLVFRMNFLQEQVVYDDPTMQSQFETWLKLQQKNAPNIHLEQKITIISILGGRTYDYIWDNMTVYQIENEFYMISQIKEFERTSNLLGNAYADLSKIKFSHFAEAPNFNFDVTEGFLKKMEDTNIFKALQDKQ